MVSEFDCSVFAMTTGKVAYVPIPGIIVQEWVIIKFSVRFGVTPQLWGRYLEGLIVRGRS